MEDNPFFVTEAKTWGNKNSAKNEKLQFSEEASKFSLSDNVSKEKLASSLSQIIH